MKVSVKLIMALYAAALRILNPEVRFNMQNADICAMAHTRKILMGWFPTIRYNGDSVPIFARFGMTSDEFHSIFLALDATRQHAASLLRDLADKYVLKLRAKSKINVAALLSAARFLEENGDKYVQSSRGECMLSFAVGLANGSGNKGWLVHSSMPQLGLTQRQWNKLYWFGYNNKGKVHTSWMPANFANLTNQQKADKAAARLRRMAIYGT